MQVQTHISGVQCTIGLTPRSPELLHYSPGPTKFDGETLLSIHSAAIRSLHAIEARLYSRTRKAHENLAKELQC